MMNDEIQLPEPVIEDPYADISHRFMGILDDCLDVMKAGIYSKTEVVPVILNIVSAINLLIEMPGKASPNLGKT